MNDFEDIKKELLGVRQNVLLKNHTTFRIGGPAKYFFVAPSSDDIEQALQAAQRLRIPFLLLSGGSNVLLSDRGFPGLVVKIQNTKYKIRDTEVWAEAGVPVSILVREAGMRGLAGLEWAGGLPGTLGGAVRGNAGAFGGEVKDSIVEVEALDKKGQRKTFSKTQCQFGYRSSVFKKKGYVVLAVKLKLKKGDAKKMQATASDHIRYRQERHPLRYPNAGSVFKNCDVRKVPKAVREQFEDVMKVDPFPVIPAAALIARANLQGVCIGDAEISTKHPNYIVNRGNARATDVLELIAQIKKCIKKKFNVDLEEEITIL